MIIRWLLTLGCVFLFCCALILLVYTRDDVNVRQEYVKSLELQKQDLIVLRKQHIELIRQLDEWNSFWEIAKNASLDPHNWHEYPVRIQDRISPQQASHIMQLLSNDISAGRDYWFVPEYIYAGPALVGTENEEQGAALEMQVTGRIMVNYHDF